ncbi:hypothetical protein FA95DRAFT_1125418 [Auriscalpium vulgare]|uniref:Uncharacterized protein n=1 Tax=Auriscalpium vulgare TaxID=40419 RepID=A0ACB8RWB1_9AGAM|nr:hypothetical protein FA95DRAFT_1125418 [Auriscalpium vulgare]
MEPEFIVDKSLSILDFLEDLRPGVAPVHLLLRPRRSGKSTLDFVQRGNPGNLLERRMYFSDRAIAREEDAVEKHFANHIVFLLDLTNVIANDMRQLRNAFLIAVQNSVSDMKSTGCFSNAAELDEHDGSFLREVLSLTTPISDRYDTGTVLRDISRIVYKLSKRPMLFLMDEYDSPIAYASEHGVHEETVDFFRQAVGGFLTNNEFVEGSLIVGITRFGDTGYLSEVDNLSVFTLRDKKYCTSCMFTAEETQAQTETLKRLDRPLPPLSFEDLTQWYEGYYSADGQRLYNTWSVMHALNTRKLQPFWLQSGSVRL